MVPSFWDDTACRSRDTVPVSFAVYLFVWSYFFNFTIRGSLDNRLHLFQYGLLFINVFILCILFYHQSFQGSLGIRLYEEVKR